MVGMGGTFQEREYGLPFPIQGISAQERNYFRNGLAEISRIRVPECDRRPDQPHWDRAGVGSSRSRTLGASSGPDSLSTRSGGIPPLDRMKPGHAFLGTTNLDVASLTERFQTRFQPVRLQPPENEVLAAFLARRWGAPVGITREIAEGVWGKVRAAMADLEMWMG